jgi:anti-anti-sigma factor
VFPAGRRVRAGGGSSLPETVSPSVEALDWGLPTGRPSRRAARRPSEEATTHRAPTTVGEAADLEIREEPLGKRPGGLLRIRGTATYRQAPKLREHLFSAIDRAGGKPTIADLEGIERIDTAAMAVLVEGLARSLEKGGDLYLTAPRESVRRVFELAGLPEALDRCFSCIEEVGPRIRLRELTEGAAE